MNKSRSSLFTQIATQLSGTEQILKAVESQNRKARPGSDAEYVAARSEEEELIAGAFAQVLGLAQVGIHDNFFDLGGHSLRATQVLARLRQIFGVELALRELFAAPTVAGLAAALALATRGGHWHADQAIARVERGAALPLGLAQQRLWLLHQLAPDSPAYNLSAALLLRGSLQVAALEQALREVARRHESLRTRFEEHDGEPLQYIDERVRLRLAVTELSGLGQAAAALEPNLRAGEGRRPFALRRGGLWRARLLRLEPEAHVLVLTLPHLIADGWSLGVLRRELVSLYAAYASGQPSGLPELALQYVDYAAWQRQQLTAQVLQQQLTYWRQRLGGASEALELPGRRLRRLGPGERRVGRRPFALREALSGQLQELAVRQGATLFMVLLSGFAVLLQRYGGQRQVRLGTVVAGRQRLESEGLIGGLVNTVVIGVEVSREQRYAEVLRAVREATLGAYANQEVPFEQVVEALQPERGAGETGLLQVMFTMQNLPRERQQVAGLEVQRLGGGGGGGKFEVTVTVSEEGGRVQGVMEYDQGVYEEESVERVLGHYERLLEGIAQEAQRRVSEYQILSAGERRQVVEEWNQTAREYGRWRSVGEMVAEQAVARPDRVAVVCGDQQLSYGELARRSNQLARYLRRQAIGPEHLVGICLERGLEMVVALLGVLKAGAAYVPLDPAYPQQRLRYMAEDAGLAYLLTTAASADRLDPLALNRLRLDADWHLVAHESRAGLNVQVLADNLAYVIYTSGSTGHPKGVQVRHGGLVNFLHSMQQVPGLSDTDVLLAVTTLSFDIAGLELLLPLVVGAKVEVASREEAQDGRRLRQRLQASQATLMQATPASWRLLLDAGLEVLAGVKVLCGGEAMTRELAASLRRAAASLWNMYGPTETTIWSTLECVERGEVSVGGPISNTEVYILDGEMGEVGVGMRGEVYIGGAGLARGYQGQAGETAARFVASPYKAGERVYRTGDEGRRRGDGKIEVMGRKDEQVKVRGYRIELAEIEAALNDHPAVRQSVVTVRESADGDKLLVAYLDTEYPEKIKDADLRNDISQKLPDYMLPSAFVLLSALPLTPNGKVDRRSLPAPDLSRLEHQQQFVAARSEEEELIAGAFAQVLGLAQVGIHDNFFDLGGHSLRATQVLARLRQIFGVELALRELFAAPTVAGLAAALALATRGGHWHADQAIARVERGAALPLGLAQQRLWLLHQLAPDSPAYNLSAALLLRGSLQVAALEQALREVARRHESLRTRFEEHDGEPLQYIDERVRLRLAVTELSGLGQAAAALEPNLRAGEGRRPFALRRGGLWRARLLRLEPEAHVLVLTLPHLIADGWSLGVLRRELVSLYAAYASGQPSGLPELALQYVDYAAWQRQQLTAQVLQQQLTYWRQRLGGASEALELPGRRLRRLGPGERRVGRRPFALREALSGQLQELAVRQGATLFMVLLSGFAVLLQRYGGQRQVRLGTVVAGRQRLESEGLIGGLVNTVVIGVEVSREQRYAEVLRAVREATLGAYANQEVPFEQVVEALQPERGAGETGLLQVMFTMQNLPRERQQVAGLEVQRLGGGGGGGKFEVTVTVSEEGGRVQGVMEYDQGVYEEESVERVLGHYERLLEGIAQEAQRRVSEYQILSAGERRQVVEEWNQTAREYGRWRSVGEMVAEQAVARPDRVAVVCGDQQLSYGELARRSNQLARYLRRQAIGPEHLVGICLERGLEMVVALLGVLKAGAAYVPLDPAYPQQRLAMIVEEAGMRVIVTQQKLIDQLPEFQGSVIILDSHQAEWSQLSRTSINDRVSPSNLAYVIYTSGSTGVPKGAMNTHAGMVNRLQWMQEQYNLTPDDSVLQKTPYSFDVSVWEFFWPLMTAARLIIARPGGHQDAAYLASLICEEGVTTIHFVPSMLAVFLDEKEAEQCPSLTRVICSGEALAYELQERYYSKLGAALHNLYGPTEAAVDVTYWACQPTSEAPIVPIGRPIANIQLYVLDRDLNEVPLGASGELFIGGIGLGRGYLNRPEMTADRFIANRFSNLGGERLYKTGDLVRYLPDGQIEYLGRIDHQVKLNGARIELGEIERALRKHAAVRDAVVVVHEESSGNKQLIAYIVTASDGNNGAVPLNPADVRSFLKTSLPDYMVPSTVAFIDKIPLSANGKINRKALPTLDRLGAQADRAYTAPRTPVEEMLAAIWATVLCVDQLGIFDNFFELGGHSLLGMKVLARVRQVFRVQIELQALFASPTVAEFAQALIKHEPKPGHVTAIARIYKKVGRMSLDEVKTGLKSRGKGRDDGLWT